MSDATYNANWASLAGKATTALTNNETFLGIVSPTDPQAIAQVQALTRQVDAIIRVLLGQLGVTDGT